MESCFSSDRNGWGVEEWVIGGQMEKRGGEGRRVKQWRVVMQSGVGC